MFTALNLFFLCTGGGYISPLTCNSCWPFVQPTIVSLTDLTVSLHYTEYLLYTTDWILCYVQFHTQTYTMLCYYILHLHRAHYTGTSADWYINFHICLLFITLTFICLLYVSTSTYLLYTLTIICLLYIAIPWRLLTQTAVLPSVYCLFQRSDGLDADMKLCLMLIGGCV